MRSKQELPASEEIYSRVFRFVRVPIAITTLSEGRIVDANDSFLRLTGLGREQVIGRTAFELNFWPELGFRAEFVRKLQDEGRVIDLEIAFRIPSGELRTGLLSAYIIELPGERWVITQWRDITERKEAEEELRQQKDILQTIFDYIPVMVASFDSNNKVQMVNRETERVLGWSLKEWQKQNILPLCLPDPAYRQEALNYMLTKPPGWRDFKVRTLDGTVLDVMWANVQLSNGMGIGIGQDITARKRAEEALRSLQDDLESQVRKRTEELVKTNEALRTDIAERKRAEEKLFELASIVEFSDDAIISGTLESTIVSWNRGAERLYGYSSEEVNGRPASLTIPHDRCDEFQRLRESIRKGETVEPFDTVRLRKDGKRIDVSVTASPIRNAAGEMTGISVIVRDISVRKRVEEALRRTHDELETQVQKRTEELVQVNKALGADISERKRVERALRTLSGRLLHLQDEERRRIARELHDSTSQSLTALLMNLAVINHAAAKLSPRARKAASESQALAEQCLREIRTLSQLLHPPNLDQMGLAPAIRLYVKSFQQRSLIRLHLDMPRKLGRLPQEVETTLFRIVQEALTNIHLHSGSPTANIRIVRNSTEVILEVEDKGRGLPATKLQRSHDPIAPVGVGTAGMQERLRQLGGQLELHSSSQGTTVKAWLPLEEGNI